MVYKTKFKYSISNEIYWDATQELRKIHDSDGTKSWSNLQQIHHTFGLHYLESTFGTSLDNMIAVTLHFDIVDERTFTFFKIKYGV